MKNLIEAKLKRFLSCMLSVTVMTTTIQFPGRFVYASEEGAYTEGSDWEQETTEVWESETSAFEKMNEMETKDEMESESDLEEETETVTQEEIIKEVVSEDTTEEEVTLVSQQLSQKIGACQVSVYGKMPEEATLSVKTQKMTEKQKREIANLSDIVENTQELEDEDILVYSYDISIVYQNEEYEPYLFDEKMEVSLQLEDVKEAEEIEVFHVSSETAKTEQISEVEKKADEIVFEADHFSQYILIAQTTYKKQTTWSFVYTGDEDTLTIPATGIYEIKLYGAQGENSDSYEGGKGGFVSAFVSLQKKDMLTIQIAGQDGYPDAGTGAGTHGGGATRLYVNGALAAVAGGGGGALPNRDGGFGGTSQGKVTGTQGESSDVSHSAGGGAGYQGGKHGYVIYHTHTGDESVEGGCYTKEVYHSHTQACFGVVCSHRNLTYLGTYYDETGDDYSDWKCTGCGRGFVSNTSYGEPSPSPTYGWTCKKDGAIEGYSLGCGMTTETIVDSQASYGGSNYLSSICEEGISQSGIREGDGMVQVSLVKLDCATLRYENDGKEFKTYQIERGTEFTELFTETPQKPEDERYSYTFLGWDNLATTPIETMTKEETIKGTMNGNRNFNAVYGKNPQTYVLHFENDEKVPHGTQSILATYDSKMEDIIVPKKEGYIFAGYYADITDEASKYFDAYGKPIRYADFTRESTLTAKWEDPLSITKNPTDQTITAGYSGVVLTMEATLMPANGYQLNYQWYVNTKKDVAGAKEIESGFTNKLLIPQDYPVGDYYFFAKATATGSVDQTIEKYTDIATVHVTKGILGSDRLEITESHFTFDGTFHELKASVKNEPHAEIYYGKEPLNSSNYYTLGSKTPQSFKNAGEYNVYVYVVSDNYDDFSDKLVMKIDKAIPDIYLASKNTTYRENVVQGVDKAVVYGVDKKPLTDMSVKYTYYTDNALKNKTQAEHGAKVTGGAPSEIGTYYVSAKVEESPNYQAAETMQSAMLNILGTHVPYTVSDYIGVYDGKPHGISVSIQNKDRVTFYYAKDKKLTEDTYLTNGDKNPVTFTDAGEYIVYYAAANKLTNELSSVDIGSANVIIAKAVRELGTELPTVNPDHTLKIPENTSWEYKKQDGKTKEWTLYQPGEKLPNGSYELRMPEDKNYEASASIKLQVGPKPGNGNSGGNGENGGNDGNSGSEENGGSSPSQGGSTGKNPANADTATGTKNPAMTILPGVLPIPDISAENLEKIVTDSKTENNLETGKWRPKKIPEKTTQMSEIAMNTEQSLHTIMPEPVATAEEAMTIAFPQLEKEVLSQLSDAEKENGIYGRQILLYALSGFFAGALTFGFFLLFFLFWKKKKDKEEEEISKTEKLC